MKKDLMDPVIRFLSGGPVLALLLAVSFGWAFMHLSALKTESDQLQEDVNRKQASFTSNIATAVGSTQMKFAKNELHQWENLTKHEAQRIAALSSTAQTANVTIVSLRSLDSAVAVDESITQLSHEIDSVGGQQEIAKFLDGIYAMEGMASIESLVIAPEDEDDPETLYASMKVTWFAPMAKAEVAP